MGWETDSLYCNDGLICNEGVYSCTADDESVSYVCERPHSVQAGGGCWPDPGGDAFCAEGLVCAGSEPEICSPWTCQANDPCTTTGISHKDPDAGKPLCDAGQGGD